MTGECSGICIRAYEILPGGTAQIAYAHPDCPVHGHLAIAPSRREQPRIIWTQHPQQVLNDMMDDLRNEAGLSSNWRHG